MKSALAENTAINDRYSIHKVITTKIHNQINYLCVDNTSGKQVVVKEFFPAYATRNAGGQLEYSRLHDDDIDKFTADNNMARIYGKIPTLTKVYEVFSANNTAYAVCEYCPGRTVQELMARGYEFKKTTVQNIMIMLLKTNISLAKFNICNRNFRPDNIVVTKDGYIKLQEFQPGKNSIYEVEAVKSVAALGFYLATGEDTDAVGNVKKHRSDPRMQDMLKYVLYVVNDTAEVTTSEFYNAALLRFDQRQLNWSVPAEAQIKPAAAPIGSFVSKKTIIIVVAVILALVLAVFGAVRLVGSFKNADDKPNNTETSQNSDVPAENSEETTRDTDDQNVNAQSQATITKFEKLAYSFDGGATYTDIEYQEFEDNEYIGYVSGFETRTEKLLLKFDGLEEQPESVHCMVDGIKVSISDGKYDIPIGDAIPNISFKLGDETNEKEPTYKLKFVPEITSIEFIMYNDAKEEIDKKTISNIKSAFDLNLPNGVCYISCTPTIPYIAKDGDTDTEYDVGTEKTAKAGDLIKISKKIEYMDIKLIPKSGYDSIVEKEYRVVFEWSNS